MKVSIIAAITVDGKIAKSPNHFPEWTGKSDKNMFASITKKAGVVIMGSKTFDLIDKSLPGRQVIVMTQKATRVSRKKNIIFTNESPECILGQLELQGYKHALVCGGAQINHLFATKKLIDELIITFSPIVFGKGISLFSKKIDLNLKLKSARLIDSDSICIVYKILN